MKVAEAIQAARHRVGMDESVDLTETQTILDVFEEAIRKYSDRPAYSCLGVTITYAELDQFSRNFAAYLQNETSLQAGDRVAVQLINVIQYPIVLFGILRAGMIVVNTNPLYTEREMLHQFNDSGAKGLVILANMASKAEAILPKTSIHTVIDTQIGDMAPAPKRWIINSVIKHVKKMVPAYSLPQAVPFLKVLSKGEGLPLELSEITPDSIAALQYTGGTTGVAKGAMLTHANLVANMRQSHCVVGHLTEIKSLSMVCPLPLYHIYAFTVHCMVGMEIGAHNQLIPNPRDLPAFVKALQKQPFHVFVGLNTLFVALANNKAFQQLDFSNLKLTLSGGMALTEHASSEWQKVTHCPITEGYGLTETSPIACANPPGHEQVGCIGLPVPNTEVKIVGDQGQELPIGEAGEMCVRGPQIMKGYWNRPEATAEVIDSDGWLHTGDIALVQEDGYSRIVDRAKDMILVSGFNVYPNELENVLTLHPDVVECAAIGMPHAKSGEVVKMFVVKSSPELTEQDVITYMREQVTSYKVPKSIEFRDDLPKSNVGKILRKELRPNAE